MVNQRLRDDPSDLPRLALALAKLALVGFSLVLTGQMAWLNLTQRSDFASRNILGQSGRLILLLSLCAGLAIPAGLGLMLVARRGVPLATPLLERLATRLAPLGALFMLPPLFLSQIARDKPLYYLIALSAFGLSFDALLARSFALGVSGSVAAFLARLRRRPLVQALLNVPRGVPLSLLLLIAGLSAYLLAGYGISHHRLIQDASEYLGVPDNVLANLRHGRYFKAPVLFGATAAGNYLTVHAEYGSLLFTPLYALRPGAETLIWLGAALAGLAAVPLYLLAARTLGRGFALWIAVAFLLSAPMHGALLAGFSWLHAVTLFSFTLYYAVESERRWLLGSSLLLLLSISELGPLNVFVYGLMLLASRRKARLGVWLSLLALPLIAFNFWLSAHRPGAEENPLLLTLAAFYKNPAYFVWDLARFSKLTPILHALAPLCLLPLFEFASWTLLLPGLLVTSAATQFWPTNTSGYAFALVWLPGTFLALLLALEKRRARGAGRAPLVAAVLALSVTILSHSYNYGALLRADGFGGIPAENVRGTAWGESRYNQLLRVLRLIPAQASVAATTYLVSFVSNRPDACDLLRACGRPDYLLLSSREVASVRPQLKELFATHEYRLFLTTFDEFYLFKRAPETPETRAALGRLELGSP
jgi:uncharacterized membrane protein